jgi:hypothetical protein
MYVVTFTSMVAVLRGRRYGWNKLERSGHIELRKVCAADPG